MRHDKPRTPGDGGGFLPPSIDDPLLTAEGPMRRELLRQIERLEAEISAFVVANCPYEPPPTSAWRDGPRVLTTSELEDVRDELVAMRSELHERIVQQEAEQPPPAPGRTRLRGRAPKS